MKIEEYSDEEIRKEYLNRKLKLNCNWYYAPYDDDTDPDWSAANPTIAVVHRRLWHITKRFSNFDIKNKLFLPKIVFEKRPSHFSPKSRDFTHEKMANLFEKRGFVRLNQSFDFNKYSLNQVFYADTTLKKTWVAFWVCDTPELKELAENWIKNTSPNYKNHEDLHKQASEMAQNYDCVAYNHTTYTSVGTTNIAFMKKEVFDTLPPSPYKKNILRTGCELP